MAGQTERQGKSPEKRALDNFLDLGYVAVSAARTLEAATKLLESTERVTAPDGKIIVVRPVMGQHDLIIEKFMPPSGEARTGYFSQHFADSIDSIPGVRLLDREELFYGKYMEFDRNANGFYVYYPTGESRALHRVEGLTTVTMHTQEWLDEL